jgi:hypothetical protein
MPCGAFVWLVCPSGVDVVPATAQEDAGVLLAEQDPPVPAGLLTAPATSAS